MLKQRLRLPQQENMEMVTGGIKGIHKDISPIIRPLGLLSVSKNMKRFGVTGAETRQDRISLGSLGGIGISALSAYYKSADNSKYLISGTGESLYKYNGTSWDIIKTELTPGKFFNAASLNDIHILTNGVDNVLKYTGGLTASDLGGSPPKSPFVTTAYQRVFLVQLPSSLRISDIAAPEIYTGGDSASIPINDRDGDEVKWVQLYKTNVVVWKRYSIHEIHGPEAGRLTSDWRVFNIAKVGTVNGRTIADVNGVLYWLSDSANAKGIVRWSGGRPVLISGPVQQILDSINYEHIDKACATTDGDGSYMLSIPTGLSSEPDTTIVFDTKDETWWVWVDWSPTSFASYRLDNKELVVMGDSNGQVYAMLGDD